LYLICLSGIGLDNSQSHKSPTNSQGESSNFSWDCFLYQDGSKHWGENAILRNER
jgi:hypothetical protein